LQTTRTPWTGAMRWMSKGWPCRMRPNKWPRWLGFLRNGSGSPVNSNSSWSSAVCFAIGRSKNWVDVWRHWSNGWISPPLQSAKPSGAAIKSSKIRRWSLKIKGVPLDFKWRHRVCLNDQKNAHAFYDWWAR
jgi:hypothetical protein